MGKWGRGHLHPGGLIRGPQPAEVSPSAPKHDDFGLVGSAPKHNANGIRVRNLRSVVNELLWPGSSFVSPRQHSDREAGGLPSLPALFQGRANGIQIEYAFHCRRICPGVGWAAGG